MLAQRPPMGWNSWNTFGPDINEDVVLETAAAMVEQGYLDAGYEYVVIDDCWSLRERDENGRLVPDPEKFPHGMKYVADRIHALGLKFGMYTAAGALTCSGYPGSFGHEYEDARQFAEWEIDFLKYDICHFPGRAIGNVRNSYLTMSMALRSTGREILFSGCTVGGHDPATWMRSVGAHMFRSTGDINDSYDSIRNIVQSQLDKLHMSGPGCFNDMDMLVAGMYGKGNTSYLNGCTSNEYTLHFSLWCLCGVPLMIGADIRNLDSETKALLQNKALIAINQDEENRPPYYEEKQRYASKDRMGLMKIMSDGSVVLGYYNFSDRPLDVLLYFDDIGLPYYSGMGLKLTDIMTGEEIGVKYDFYNPPVEPHSCRLFRAEFVRR